MARKEQVEGLMPNAAKYRTPKNGHLSHFSEWRLDGESVRFRFCTMLSHNGVISDEIRRQYEKRLVAARFGTCVGLFEELPDRPV